MDLPLWLLSPITKKPTMSKPSGFTRDNASNESTMRNAPPFLVHDQNKAFTTKPVGPHLHDTQNGENHALGSHNHQLDAGKGFHLEHHDPSVHTYGSALPDYRHDNTIQNGTTVVPSLAIPLNVHLHSATGRSWRVAVGGTCDSTGAP